MPKLTGGEAIVQSLIAHGVDTIFGLPGVQNDYLYNALYDARDQIKVYHTRHEQAVAYMALGYASSTDKVGVYAVVPGVGLLNTTAALATAYSMNARVFALSGQIPSHSIGRGFGLLHEIPDQLGILRSLTKWAERVNAPAEAPGLVNEAFRQLNSGRPRPVGLECPSDVFAAKAEVDLTLYAPPLYHPPVDEDAIQRAAKLLGNAKNPMIFVGSGAILAGQYPHTRGRRGIRLDRSQIGEYRADADKMPAPRRHNLTGDLEATIGRNDDIPFFITHCLR